MIRARLRLRPLVAVAITAVVMAVAPLAYNSPTAYAGPVADSPETYLLCGRVFPDPQAYWAPTLGEGTPHPGSGTSPYAKGNAPCAARTFITYDEAIRGIRFMADTLETTRDFVDLIDLSTSDDPRIREALDEQMGDGYSEGLLNELGQLEQQPLYLIKVTAPADYDPFPEDAVTPIAEQDRDHFVWSLSVHGIERAGAEGGLRAVEDLATWASQEPGRPILETYDSDTIVTQQGHTARNLSVGEVMMQSVSYFMLPNPDGWRRGDPDQGNTSFMRYNGNGMDNNRDWPEIGWTDPEFTPWSESETRTYGRVLQALTDRWTGGIDLHGMVVANAFSYTLLGGSERPYDKNQRVMQFVEQAWADAESRLAWSSLIKPNTAPDQCAPFDGVTPTGALNMPPDCDQRSYGVQYGTIWDTINYTATGAIGNWIDSPIGLNADGVDNEMMASHLGNCGGVSCYVPEFEQLHVDGNKSLIYAMLNFSLQPPPVAFDAGGDIAYLVNPRRLVDPGVAAPQAPAGAVDADDRSGVTNHPGSGTTVLAEFTVDNAAGTTFIQGIAGEGRFPVVGGESAGTANSLKVQYQDPESGSWVSRPGYSGGGVDPYRQGGQRSDWNYPKDGNYRLVVSGPLRADVTWNLTLATHPVWDQPLQAAFDVSNMDFFEDLEPWLAEGTTLTGISVDNVLSGARDLSDFDTVIAVDDALLPGYHTGEEVGQGLLDLPPTNYTEADAQAIGTLLHDFASSGGNVVLTDNSLRGAAWMGLMDAAAVQRGTNYAGHATFDVGQGYDDPLLAGLHRPGAATGRENRKQMAEPLPIGYAIPGSNGTAGNMPQWYVDTAAVTEAGGRVVGERTAEDSQAALAEIPVGEGVVRLFGSVLTFPTTAYYHPYGLSSYGVTDNGYSVLRNMLTWSNKNQNSARGELVDDEIVWEASGTPTRLFVDGEPLEGSY